MSVSQLYDEVASQYNALTAISGYRRTPFRLVATYQNVAGPLQSGMEVLDFGCGTGRLSAAFFQANPDLDITGMEPCDAMSKRALRRFAANDNLRQNFELVSAPYSYTRLPFADNSFDVVASTGVFDHIRINGNVMNDFMAVVRPGGHFAFTYERKPNWAPFGPRSISYLDGDLIKHKDAYVADSVREAGGIIKHQSDAIGYVIPRFARFGMIIAQKPE